MNAPHMMTSISPLSTLAFAAADLAGRPVPPRQWLVENLIPGKTVTVLGGDGGTGKSLLALQLGVACAAGRDWLTSLPTVGPVLYLSAEDDTAELHRRLDAITRGIGVTLAELTDLHLISLAGREAVIATPQNKTGILCPRPLWEEIRQEVAKLSPVLVVFDTLADYFGGNENDRAQVRQFVGLLRGVAIEFNCAVLLLAHPSLTGLNSGSGSSGSTAWSNSVRSRLYLDRIKGEGGSEPDPDLRVLSAKKSNYGPIGAEIRLRWRDGRFVPDMGDTSFAMTTADAKVDALFIDLLTMFIAEGRAPSALPSRTYAPSVFAKHPRSNGTRSRAFETAMNRLFERGVIRSRTEGPPSKSRTRLEIVPSAAE